MNGTESKMCGYPRSTSEGARAKAFLRLTEIVSRVVRRGERWLRFLSGDESEIITPIPFDEGLYWEAKAALECVNRSCSGECIERAGVEGNSDPLVNERRSESPLQQKADECEVLLERAGRRLSQAHEVMEATERIVEVARRLVEKAEAAYQAARDVVKVSERARYWGGGYRLFGGASEAVAAARVERARVLVALAVAIGRVSGESSTQAPTDPTSGPG